MKSKVRDCIKYSSVVVLILSLCFGACLLLQYVYEDSALISAIFVLGVFLISVSTPGYIYGIISAFISVLAVNFAFAFPYFAFDFTLPENIVSTAILLAVTVITCGLTAKVKQHEILKAESEKERMRANLLRAVSHDLRTPLTTIYSAGYALLDHYAEFTDEQKKQILKNICEDSRWLTRMVENLLSITKLDGGNVEVIKTDTVLDELIDSVLVKFEKRYPDQKIEVDIPDEFISVPMDALLIEQVLLNMFENSVQHAVGMTRLCLKISVTKSKAIFEISDNGCGIAEERLQGIFSGVYALPSDTKKNNAGIGLSVCATIIKAHGGEIRVENRKGGGCVFCFVLNKEENEDA